jgi:hypothetical protein
LGRSLTLNISETDNSLDFGLALSVAKYFRVEKDAESILKRVRRCVAKWKTVAKKYAIPASEINTMAGAFEEELMNGKITILKQPVKNMKAVKIVLGIVNLLLIAVIYIVTFQSLHENGSNDKTVLLPLVYFSLLFIINCVLLLVFYFSKRHSLVPIQRAILLVVIITGFIAVYIFSR